MRGFGSIVLILALLGAGASCQHSGKPADDSMTMHKYTDHSHDLVFPSSKKDSGAFLRGQAKVVSVDPVLGRALLEYKGRRVYGFWEVESAQARTWPMEVTINGADGPLQPVVSSQEFPAQPGDTIAFVGMQTGDNIYLRGVSVVAP